MARSVRSLFLIVTCSVLVVSCTGEGPFSVLFSRPAQLVIDVQPNGARVGSTLSQQPIVEVLDHRGRRTKEPIPVTVSLQTGNGNILGTLTVQTVNGVAVFRDLGLNGDYGPRTLTFAAPGLAAKSTSLVLLPPVRSAQDRPDDIAGPQVHVIYVLPHGASDRRLDTDVDIATSVAAFQDWLARSVGRQVRFDLYEGVLDVSFFELSASDSAMQLFGSGVVTEIERQLENAGQLKAGKRYLVYYDGGSTYSCGGAAWPPYVRGVAAALYLQACKAPPLVRRPGAAPGYWEFAALHDLVHTLGVVSTAAPNYTTSNPAHVPEPQDLMYGGHSGWALANLVVDVNHDDYFGAAVPDSLAKLENNPYLIVVPWAPQAPLPMAPLPSFQPTLPLHIPFTPQRSNAT